MKTKQQKFQEPIINCNFRVPQSLYIQVKTIALKEQKSISLWINEALEKVVREVKQHEPAKGTQTRYDKQRSC